MADYVLDPNEDEVARLLAYADREAEQVRLVCRQVGLGPGGRAIDIGCGPLGALKVLADVVGESGFVAGIDSSADALRVARVAVDRAGFPGVELVQGDVNSYQRPEWEGCFDLAYCRLMLLHQTDARETLRRTGRWVRPGGHVVYQDILDEPSFPRCEPEVPAMEEAWGLLFRLFRTKGLTPEVARDHRGLCHELGWDLVSQRGKFAVVPAAEGIATIARLLSSSRRALVEEGLITEEGMAALLSSLEEARGAAYRYWFGPLAIETVARVPDRR
jgi:ubiquinone/menaquinone biosynthesis C-methylase UbiE